MSERDACALAEFAAKLMHEEAIEEVGDALRRAVRALGYRNIRMPPAEEVRAALRRRLKLFDPASDAVLQEMRNAALDAMEFLAQFKPRLIGSVIEGGAQPSDRIKLLCECETPDLLFACLEQLRIPAEQHQKYLVSGELRQSFEFRAGKFGFELIAHTPRSSLPNALSANAAQLRRVILESAA